jgi:hypothetical protein
MSVVSVFNKEKETVSGKRGVRRPSTDHQTMSFAEESYRSMSSLDPASVLPLVSCDRSPPVSDF